MTVSQEEFESLKSVVANLRRQITDMEEQMNNHVGLDRGATGINYPHPNQQVSVLEFGGGLGKLDHTGAQFKNTSTDQKGLWWVKDEWVESPGATPIASAVGYNMADLANLTLSALSANSVGGTIILQAPFTGRGYASITGRTSSKVANIQCESDDGTGKCVVEVGGPLKLSDTAADPTTTLEDGMLWYRTDTDKIRHRANGSTVNIATEDYVDTAIAGVSGHTDIMSRLSMRF